MSWHQLLAGYLAGVGMRALYGVRYTDMCAYRAIRRDCLEGLGMREMTYGWNIEMQMKAARCRSAHSRSADALPPPQRRQIQRSPARSAARCAPPGGSRDLLRVAASPTSQRSSPGDRRRRDRFATSRFRSSTRRKRGSPANGSRFHAPSRAVRTTTRQS
jgi:hypothetical protein